MELLKEKFMLKLAPPKNLAPAEQRPWNSYRLVPGELAYAWRDKRLVRLSENSPTEVLRESRNHILWPNWEWDVVDVVSGKQYKCIEFNLIAASEIISWGINKNHKISIEFGWTGNRRVLEQDYCEILGHFKRELGEKYVEFKAPAKS